MEAAELQGSIISPNDARLDVRLIPKHSAEFDKIVALRTMHIGDNPAGEPDYSDMESIRDECSYHMGYFVNEDLVGTLRLSPFGHGITMTERAIDLSELPDNPFEACDASRLVLANAYRGGRYLGTFIQKNVEWVRAHSHFKYAIAICNDRLAQVYKKVGCKVLRSDVHWRGSNCEKLYSVVKLNFF